MTDIGGITSGQLKSFIERIERLEEEKAGISQDIKEIFSEAKANGFDTKVMKQVLKIRKMDKEELEEQEELIQLYCQALGMIPPSREQLEEMRKTQGEAA